MCGGEHVEDGEIKLDVHTGEIAECVGVEIAECVGVEIAELFSIECALPNPAHTGHWIRSALMLDGGRRWRSCWCKQQHPRHQHVRIRPHTSPTAQGLLWYTR
jgi:hypothetical protein